VGSSPTWGTKTTGCSVSQVRRPSLELGGRRFESCHPDQHFAARHNRETKTMIITANHKPVVVRFRSANCNYSNGAGEGDAQAGFDEKRVEVGHSWTSSQGDSVISVDELEG
jgi:hypothetical protein